MPRSQPRLEAVLTSGPLGTGFRTATEPHTVTRRQRLHKGWIPCHGKRSGSPDGVSPAQESFPVVLGDEFALIRDHPLADGHEVGELIRQRNADSLEHLDQP